MKLYTVKRVADLLNLSERRVRQLREQEIIYEHKPGTGLYEPRQTLHKYIDYLRNGSSGGDEAIDYNTERAKLVRAKRLDAEYDLQVKEGELHHSSDVEAVLKDMLTIFKARMLAIPANLSPILSKKTDKKEIFRLLKESVDEALFELSKYDDTFRGRGEKIEGSDT